VLSLIILKPLAVVSFVKSFLTIATSFTKNLCSGKLDTLFPLLVAQRVETVKRYIKEQNQPESDNHSTVPKPLQPTARIG